MKKRLLIAPVVVALLLATGCKPKEVTSLQRKEAATLASEAQFAVQLKDYARAEATLAKAAELAPDTGTYWVDLGTLRMRQGKRDAARNAYKSGLAAYQAAAKSTTTDAGPLMQQIYVYALLGQPNDARAALEKAMKQFPDNRTVRSYAEAKQLDKMLADPRFKEIAL
jgi:Flp pilus assembly protein TadD